MDNIQNAGVPVASQPANAEGDKSYSVIKGMPNYSPKAGFEHIRLSWKSSSGSEKTGRGKWTAPGLHYVLDVPVVELPEISGNEMFQKVIGQILSKQRMELIKSVIEGNWSVDEKGQFVDSLGAYEVPANIWASDFSLAAVLDFAAEDENEDGRKGARISVNADMLRNWFETFVAPSYSEFVVENLANQGIVGDNEVSKILAKKFSEFSDLFASVTSRVNALNMRGIELIETMISKFCVDTGKSGKVWERIQKKITDVRNQESKGLPDILEI